MSLDNPLSFFDVSGRVALITGASGAFGAVAARCLSGAGCRVALAALGIQTPWPGLPKPAAVRRFKSTPGRIAKLLATK